MLGRAAIRAGAIRAAHINVVAFTRNDARGPAHHVSSFLGQGSAEELAHGIKGGSGDPEVHVPTRSLDMWMVPLPLVRADTRTNIRIADCSASSVDGP